MYVVRLRGIPSVSSRVLIEPRLPRLPSTRLQHRPARSFHKLFSPYLRPKKPLLDSPYRAIGPPKTFRPFIQTLWNSTRMENGHVRHKRKGSPGNTHDRPAKLLKQERSDTHNSDQSLDSQYMYGSDSIADAMVEPIVATGENAEWQATIEQVVKNVVSIHFCQTCPFDTSPALSSEATGFVVDAAKGYILTNRHVVGSGPFWGYCIFDNHEEVGSFLRSFIETC